MITNDDFSIVGFDESVRGAFWKLIALIEAPAGCNAKVYRTPKMLQIRASHVAPGEDGTKKAKQVFAMIEPRKQPKSFVVRRRKHYSKGKPKHQRLIQIHPDFSDWAAVEGMLREWSFDPKPPAGS